MKKINLLLVFLLYLLVLQGCKKPSRIAFIVGSKLSANDINKCFPILTKAYGSKGFKTYQVNQVLSLAHIEAEMAHAKNTWGGEGPEFVAFHFVGHGTTYDPDNCGCTGLMDFGNIITLVNNHIVPATCVPVHHKDLAIVMQRLFPNAILIGTFDACYQGPAIIEFPLGAKSICTGCVGKVMTSTNTEQAGIGTYSIAFGNSLLSQKEAPGTTLNMIFTKSHIAGASAVANTQFPQIIDY